jgi:hypothetical protein
MRIPDLSLKTYNEHNEYRQDGFEYRSVGWLGDSVERPGETELEIVLRIQRLMVKNQLFCSERGTHSCEICLAENGADGVTWKYGETTHHGEFFVQRGSTRYVLPNLVIHYISRHRYKLPDVVEQAIREGPE